MSSEKPKIKVIVGPVGGKPVFVIDTESERLLLYLVTYNKNIKPGEYEDPAEIVRIFKELATRGHETKSSRYNPMIIFESIVSLLKTHIPMDEKVKQVMKYVRSVIK